MGLNVILETEKGERLSEAHDPRKLLNKILPDATDRSYEVIRFIDRYGHTLFNGVQIPYLLEDLKKLVALTQDNDTLLMLQRVRELAMRCEKEPHLYIRVLGD